MVVRSRLLGLLNEGLRRKLTLISAPAGFGKTTLISEWVAGCGWPVAWLSLDAGDNDPTRFLMYFITALQTVAPNIGAGVLPILQSPQPPTPESILTTLLNELSTLSDDFVLVLDDYHVIDAKPVEQFLHFLLEHLPSQMHLVIATREDPQFPLARYRAQNQLTELRAADLRFTPSEAFEFLNRSMGLDLSAEDTAALETRTEGWIAGLQLAAISMQGRQDVSGFIQSFTGSHHFVMDYLVEEVLRRQPPHVQTFLLRTSILDRMCAPLCNAVVREPSASAQPTLEYLERASLFIIPLDDERLWYRYHHLFADLLRQRLQQKLTPSPGNEEVEFAELHRRASQWYEDNGLDIDAFHHAVAAGDVERATRLIEGRGRPLHLRGALAPVLHWLESLPPATLDARPVLWVMYAGALTTAGQTIGVEEKLQAAENALQNVELDIETRDLLGRVANNRATLAVTRYEPDKAIAQARRALEYLRPDNLPFRTMTSWSLGVAYQLSGDRPAATQAFTQALSISQAIGHDFVTKLATIGLGNMQERDNRLILAAETYRRALQLFGDQPLSIACEAHLGLARILYEWNDLEAAELHGQQSLQLARQYASVIDRYIFSEVFLARLRLAQGDAAGAAAILARADQSVRQNNFVHRMPEVAAAQVLTLLRQGNLGEAAQVAQAHDLPLSQARVHVAQGNASAALALLEPFLRDMEAKGWSDERLNALILMALARQAHGERDKALRALGDALVLAEPGGFIRLFVDEGIPMAQLLTAWAARGSMPGYIGKLLGAFESTGREDPDRVSSPATDALIEPLSQRELEILRFIARGLSNEQISKRLFLALSTVKGHNRSIFNKLGVQRRTEAVARARELGLL